MKGRKTLDIVETRIPEQDDLIVSLAEAGLRGLVRVPHEADECRRVTNAFQPSIMNSRPSSAAWWKKRQRTRTCREDWQGLAAHGGHRAERGLVPAPPTASGRPNCVWMHFRGFAPALPLVATPLKTLGILYWRVASPLPRTHAVSIFRVRPRPKGRKASALWKPRPWSQHTGVHA